MARRSKYPFPTVRIREQDITFNVIASEELEGVRSVQVAKRGQYLYFIPLDNMNGYHLRKVGASFVIRSATIRAASQIKNGTYKLYKRRDGGYALNINEPLNKMQ